MICVLRKHIFTKTFLEEGLYIGCVASWAQVEILSHFLGENLMSLFMLFCKTLEDCWTRKDGELQPGGSKPVVQISALRHRHCLSDCVCLWPYIRKYSSAVLLCICRSAVYVLDIIFLCQCECCISVCQKYSTCLRVLLPFKVFWKSLFILIGCISAQDPSLCTF